jgi:hypothetical protein
MHRGFQSLSLTSGVSWQGAIKKKRMTRRSTLCNGKIKETTEDTGTEENKFQIRRRGDPSDALMM